MRKKRLPKSIRKYIRLQKSILRKQGFNKDDVQVQINELVNSLKKRYIRTKHSVDSIGKG